MLFCEEATLEGDATWMLNLHTLRKLFKHNQSLTLTYQQELGVIHMYIIKRISLYSEVCVADGGVLVERD
jgi:hypothetical protein